MDDVVDPAPRLLILLCGLSLLSASVGRAEQDGPRSGITYRIEERAKRAEVRRRFDDRQVALLEKLNRADAPALDGLPLLVVPDVWLGDERVYSPLPASYPGAAAHPKMLVVHLPGQAFGAYEWGELAGWGPVSSGARSTPTAAGRLALTWRSRGHASSVDPDWFLRWYFNFDSREGLAFHEYRLPGGPASHGCIRLLARDARWLYSWGDGWTLDPRTGRVVAPGTPVLIMGPYAYDEPPPWRSLDWLRGAVELP